MASLYQNVHIIICPALEPDFTRNFWLRVFCFDTRLISSALSITTIMFFTNLIVLSLIAATVAVANPIADPLPYKLAMMSVNEAFGLVGRQSNGYAPSSIFCGKGNDCQSACGTSTAQCASTDGRLHCKSEQCRYTWEIFCKFMAPRQSILDENASKRKLALSQDILYRSLVSRLTLRFSL